MKNVAPFLSDLTLRNKSPKTIRAYRSDLNQFRRYLKSVGKGSARRVKPADIRGFLKELIEAGNKRTTQRRKLETLRSFFRFLVNRGVVKKNPAMLVRATKIPDMLPRYMSEKDVAAFLEAIPVKGLSLRRDKFTFLRDKAYFETMYGSGCRTAELTGADLKGLSLDTATIRVLGKRSQERIAHLTSYAVDALQKYLPVRAKLLEHRGRSHSEVIFFGWTLKRISTRSVRRKFKKYLEMAGLSSEFSPHALRHSFATHLINRGANIREIQCLMGHQRISSTQAYTCLDYERKIEAYKHSFGR